jgi:hypothetical protein
MTKISLIIFFFKKKKKTKTLKKEKEKKGSVNLKMTNDMMQVTSLDVLLHFPL